MTEAAPSPALVGDRAPTGGEPAGQSLRQAASAAPRAAWAEGWRRLKQNRLATLCLWVAAGIFAICTLYAVPQVVFFDFGLATPPSDLPVFFQHYAAQDLAHIHEAPSPAHWFGTDALGRDLFARVLFGGFLSFLIGVLATVVASVIGVVWGVLAGYFGGIVDTVLMRIVDVLYGLPFMLVLILIKVVADEVRRADAGQAASQVSIWWGIAVVFLVLGAYSWLTMARLARGQILAAKNAEYVLAARAIGATHRRIMFTHLLPNIIGPVVVYAAMSIPQVILLEAFLSFLGLGISAPHCSWGTLADDGLKAMGTDYWWVAVLPALVMVVALFALNFLGDGVRDALDPRQRRTRRVVVVS